MRTTHTFVQLALSPAVFREIYDKLRAAGYMHAFIHDGERLIIDMHGIAVVPEEPERASVEPCPAPLLQPGPTGPPAGQTGTAVISTNQASGNPLFKLKGV